MPLKDVTMKIDVKKAARLTGLGKPLILANFPGPSTFENYSELEDVQTDFGAESVAYKLAETILKQGDSSPAVVAIATYDVTADLGDEPDAINTAAKALRKYFDEDFYFVTADVTAVNDMKEISAIVEGEGIKIYGVTVRTQSDLDALELTKPERTFAAVHETAGEYPVEALIGGHGSKEVGSITYQNKKLVGITPQDFSVAKLAEIEAKNGFAFVTKSGHNVTSEGKTLSGEYIDVVHSKDWLIVNGANAIQEQLITNDKVAYTDKGFVLLASALENVLKAGVAQGMISVTDNIPDYTINVVPRSQTNAADRAGRVYNGLSFTFNLAGAVHRANIRGEMVI